MKLNSATLNTRDCVKYLGMHFDKSFTWKHHLTAKRKQADLKVKKLYSILGRKSRLNLHNKFLLYRVAIIRIWSYGIQVRGCAKKLNIDIIQNKALRTITSAPWYVNNETIHKNLRVKYIREIIQVATSHKQKIVNHSQ